MELVLKILEYFESRQEISVIQDLEIEDYDRQTVAYHLRIMYQAGLLVAEEITSKTTKKRLINVWPFELTWE